MLDLSSNVLVPIVCGEGVAAGAAPVEEAAPEGGPVVPAAAVEATTGVVAAECPDELGASVVAARGGSSLGLRGLETGLFSLGLPVFGSKSFG